MGDTFPYSIIFQGSPGSKFLEWVSLTALACVRQTRLARWEDRALLGSNLSAVTGPRRMGGAAGFAAPRSFMLAVGHWFCLFLSDWRNALNPGGLGATPPRAVLTAHGIDGLEGFGAHVNASQGKGTEPN